MVIINLMKKSIKIEWQRLITNGETCPRCSATEQEIDDALTILKQMLEPRGFEVLLEKREITPAEFEDNPLESNRILINGRSLEEWLKADVGASPCCDVCGTAQCRTIELNKRVYESIPAELIVQAGLAAAKIIDAD